MRCRRLTGLLFPVLLSAAGCGDDGLKCSGSASRSDRSALFHVQPTSGLSVVVQDGAVTAQGLFGPSICLQSA